MDDSVPGSRARQWVAGGVAIVLTVAASALWLGRIEYRQSQLVYQAPYYDPARTLRSAENERYSDAVLALTLLEESPGSISFQLDYTRADRKQGPVFTCGNVIGGKSHWGSFSCVPSEIHAGKSTTRLSFSLLESAPSPVCSTGIGVTFYEAGGSPLFEQRIPFEKLWTHGRPTLPDFIVRMGC